MSRLYVLVRGDLPAAHKAVQAGHAVAEWTLSNKGWLNETLVYLTTKDKNEFDTYFKLLDLFSIPFSSFKEPDLGGETTALATADPLAKKIFKDLPLL